MKTNQTLAVRTYQLDYQLEKKLESGHASILENSRKNAKHLASRNLPALVGDNLNNYTGEIKAGYEKLSAEVLQALQPAANLPEASIDAQYMKAKDTDLDKEIGELDHKNENDQYVLDDYNPKIIKRRIQIGLIITAIILFGEVLFNTKSFQVTGESLLFALLLSICISFAVYLLSHAVPLLYKWVRHTWQRRLVIILSLLLVTGLFTALAIFRSAYLEAHEIHIKPVYFVIINLFFFIVSTVVSFFVLPTWSEIRENSAKLKIYHEIEKRKEQIKDRKNQKAQIKDEVRDKTKERLRILYLANYVVKRIEKMYQEAIAAFKTTNMNFREDRKSPNCFNYPVEEMQVNEQAFTLLNPETK